MIKYTVFSTALGWMGFVATEKGIYASVLPQSAEFEAETELLKRCPGRPELDPQAFDYLRQQVIEYLSGENIKFNCRVDWSWATQFQKRVLQHVMAVSRGEIRTYGEMAAMAGSPLAARAVGKALGANNIPIIIPCHRVVQKNHQLGGFTGAGIELKATLLNLEGVDLHKTK